MRSGQQLLWHHSGKVILGLGGAYPVMYYINARMAGWTIQERNEFVYARNLRMLRNIQIKH
jgi:hypothetical protein